MSSELVEENLAKLGDPNRGRIVVAVRGMDGASVQLFTGMGGRSEGSKNRKYILIDDLNGHGPYARTEVFDPQKQQGNAAATLYDAQRTWHNWHVASNGEQTTPMAVVLAAGGYFEQGQRYFTHEGSKNANTPRITVAVNDGNFLTAYFGIILPDPEAPDDIKRSMHCTYTVGSNLDHSFWYGDGFFTATYDGQGGTGANYEHPWKIYLPGSLEENMDALWNAWDPNTRGNLCGREIHMNSGQFTYAFRSIHDVDYDQALMSFAGRRS